MAFTHSYPIPCFIAGFHLMSGLSQYLVNDSDKPANI